MGAGTFEFKETHLFGRAVRWCLQIVRRPLWLALLVLLLAVTAFAAMHAWAWYQFRAGQLALAQYQNESARAHLQHCRQIWPRHAPALLLAARAERRAGNFVQAEQFLDECRKWADPDLSAAIAFEWSLLQAASGDVTSVEQVLQAQVISRPADAPLIWEALAEGYRRSYRMRDALAVLNTWLAIHPDEVQAYFLRGEVHRQVGAVSRAREEYQLVLDRDDGHDEARRHLARCLVQIGRYQEAAGHLEALLHKTPRDAYLRTLLARAQYDLGHRDQAIRLLDEVLRDEPDYGLALRERGRLALAAEKFADAEKWLRQAVNVMPNNYEAIWAYHQALRGAGKTEEAKVQLAKAQLLKDGYERIHEIQTHQMTLRPQDASLHAELGELLIQIGQRDAGEHWLLNALKLNPAQANAHAALAKYYEERGNAPAAANHAREAARLRDTKKN
jgi:tetratricopeptide (TPR) repeat protein